MCIVEFVNLVYNNKGTGLVDDLSVIKVQVTKESPTWKNLNILLYARHICAMPSAGYYCKQTACIIYR